MKQKQVYKETSVALPQQRNDFARAIDWRQTKVVTFVFDGFI